MTAVRGTTVDVPTQDGTADAYLAHPDDGAAHPGVLCYMDAFGPRPHLRGMADRLAEAGYTVLLPNVFYRIGRAPIVELPEFIDMTVRPNVLERIGPYMMEHTPDRAIRDADSYLRYLSGLPQTADGPVGITGYCMGALLALRTAGTYPDRVAAAAGFHGAALASESEDSPHLLADQITAELYFAHADQDPAMPAEQIERLDAALSSAGVRHRTEVYTGANHGYTQADTSAYSAEAAERHWTALLDLFNRTLPATANQ